MGDRNIEWELEEGIPQVEDPFIQQYLKGREALIAEEQKRRHGKISAISLINNLNFF
jgi:adenosine deaminase CECR1